jgi:hypothetical protein
VSSRRFPKRTKRPLEFLHLKGVDFEMSFEHKLALAQAQTAESIAKIER